MHSKINVLSKTHAGRGLISLGVLLLSLLLWLALSAPNTAQSTNDCAPTRLEPWAQAQVMEGQGSNRLRNAPDVNGAIMGEIPVLVPIDILNGPICEDGILWWEVEARGERAFTAEADGDEYFLERINNTCAPSELLPGGAAFLEELNAREVDLYSRPRLEATFAPTPTNRRDTLYLTEQSVCAQNTRWWQATAEDGSSGWVIETQQQARQLNPAPRLERGDFGVIVEPSAGLTPPSLSDYTLAYADEGPDIPAVIEVPEVFIHPLDGEPERISAENFLFREDVYWSPDGSRIAYQEGDTVVIVTPGETDPQIIDVDDKEFMGWSPDGTHLLWKKFTDVYRWGVINLETGDSTTLTTGARHALRRWVDPNTFELMNFAENGSRVIATVMIDPPSVTEQPLPIWTRAIAMAEDAFSPDGRIAFIYADQLVLMDRETNALQVLFNLERVQDFAWSPSGDRIAILAGSDDIPYVIDVESGEATPLVSGEAFFWARGPLRWSADGVLLMYRQNNNLTVQPANGSGPPIVIVEAYRGSGISAGDYHFRPG